MKWWKWLISSVGMVAALALCAAANRGQPAKEGIVNFGQVNEHLYRGAQPDAAGITNLARLGIKTIISLKTPGERAPAEAALARANNIIYTNVPMAGLGRPKDAQVNEVLALIESLPGPVFVHCEHGCDRTGTIIACYRIQREHWSNEKALKEAEKYGIAKLERGMRAYIVEFGKKPGS